MTISGRPLAIKATIPTFARWKLAAVLLLPVVCDVAADATISGTLAGADADGGPHRYSIVQQPPVGTLTLSATTGAFQYVSSAGGSGTVTVMFAVDDGASTPQGSLQLRYQAANNPTPPPSNGGGGGGSSDGLLLALLASLSAVARRRARRS